MKYYNWKNIFAPRQSTSGKKRKNSGPVTNGAMVSAKQLKVKLVSEDGNHVFHAGKPASGRLILRSPGKLNIARLLLTIQDRTLLLAEDVTILGSGETSYDFFFEDPLKPEGRYGFSPSDDVATVYLFPDFSLSELSEPMAMWTFGSSHTKCHVMTAGYQIDATSTRFHMPETKFALAPKTIWPFFATIVVYTAVVLLAGLAWFFLLPVLALLLVCEQRVTHNAYFSGLDNRVYVDDEGQVFLEIEPRNSITKFLDGALHFRIEKLEIVSIVLKREILLEERAMVAKSVGRSSGKYLITLPIPKSGYPVVHHFKNGEGIDWKLTLRYPRKVLPDLVYHLEIEPEHLWSPKE